VTLSPQSINSFKTPSKIKAISRGLAMQEYMTIRPIRISQKALYKNIIKIKITYFNKILGLF
jgi:hypothetical protein